MKVVLLMDNNKQLIATCHAARTFPRLEYLLLLAPLQSKKIKKWR